MTAADLEPPRRCQHCQRRMIVQVLPLGWTARCSEHGQISSAERAASQPANNTQPNSAQLSPAQP